MHDAGKNVHTKGGDVYEKQQRNSDLRPENHPDGQIGIRSVLDTSMRPGLRKALESQLREYDSIETEAHSIATQRGWDMDELDPSVRLWSNLMTRMKLNGRNTDSKIADMMIQGNTKGMIKGLKTLHQFGQQDEQINTLSQKLLDCENANIRQMQGYL